MNAYRVIEEIGSGGFSTVYKCELDGKFYALKVVHLTSVNVPDSLQREINCLSLLRHPNLLHLHEVFSDKENVYLVMDLCEGGELQSRIANSPLPEDDAKVIFGQIISAVHYMHTHQVAHRDLKPQNILFTTYPHIKICDMGFCDYTKDGVATDTYIGSPCYCSPECLCQEKHDPRKADVWSLGVILYSMVAGSVPWNTTNESMMTRQIVKGSYTLPEGISQECANLISSMMTLDPNDRITLDEVIHHSWLEGHCVKAEVAENRTLAELAEVSSLPTSLTRAVENKKQVVFATGLAPIERPRSRTVEPKGRRQWRLSSEVKRSNVPLAKVCRRATLRSSVFLVNTVM